MRVERRGDGPTEVAVVGGIHGDEPCGPAAIERTLAADLTYRRPVAFVVANEAALAAGTRAVDEDLNRAFPGDHDGSTHEAQLAAELSDLLADCATLALHSTQSYADSFAIADALDEFAREVTPRLSIDAVVSSGPFDRGRIFESLDRVTEVECGYQGSQAAADNATTVLREFLAATGAIEATPNEAASVPAFELTERIEKQAGADYEVFASNFERVSAGEPFAAVDGEPLRADEPFYPVLVSANGYDDLFGYAARSLGTVP